MIVELDLLRRSMRDEPTCHVATIGPGGVPHVTPRWFVWLDDALYVATRQEDQTWSNVLRDDRTSVTIDRGRTWNELTGVRIDGHAEPRVVEHPDIREAMSAWHEKYRPALGGEAFERIAGDVPALGFLRIPPDRVEAWDHRAQTSVAARSGPTGLVGRD